jgi:hypothetical protein
MALDTINDFVAQARVLTQDTVVPYRYPDADLILAWNTCVLETRRLRPDLWMNVSPLPAFIYAATNAVTSSGTTLNFQSGTLPAGIVSGLLVYDVTNPGSIAAGVTTFSATNTQITLSGQIANQVNLGDTIAIIASPAPVIDPQYRMAWVYYMCGQAQMRDEEETQDTRAAVFMKMFESILTGAA